MAAYRKRPVVIEAYRFNIDSMPMWMKSAIDSGNAWYQGGEAPYMTIKAIGVEMRASVGDWIIKGVAGEIYPCRDDIFLATYEPA
jgi:hypothetical protein